jgi:uncharacterized membrane protein
MDVFLIIKVLHILSSTVLFGTGMGIAFFMLRSWASDNIHEKFFAARTTVLADYLFTAPAVIVQPITGAWLVWQGGYEWLELWLSLTYATYVIAGFCWLPVVWLQIQLKRMVIESMQSGDPLPPTYEKYFRIWFVLGWPAFIGLVVVFFLMVAKPV